LKHVGSASIDVVEVASDADKCEAHLLDDNVKASILRSTRSAPSSRSDGFHHVTAATRDL
jgi:hypothetical protein